MVANKDTIVLDSTNNVFVGPNGYFKVVIDSFDGTTIKAWHVEDPKGTKSANLAASAKGKHIDLLVTKGNRTVSHFITRYYDRFYKENEIAQADLAKAQVTVAADQKALTEKDDAIKKAGDATKAAQDQLKAAQDAAKTAQDAAKTAQDAIKPVQDAAKAAQDKAAQLQATVSQLEKGSTELKTQVDASAGRVDPIVPIGVGVVGVLAVAGVYLGTRRKQTS